MKGKVYCYKPKNTAHLNAAIQEEIELITPERRSNAMINFWHCAKCCLRLGGQHMKNILFQR